MKPHIRVLLWAGLISSVLYVATDLLCAAIYPGYSLLDHAISELSATGAPTKRLWSAMGPIYELLMIAFGIGVLRLATSNRALRVTGWLLLTFAATGFLWAFFPMHQRGTEFNWQDIGHIVLTIVTVSLILTYIGFGAFALGRRFRLYSLATILTLLAAFAVTFARADRIAAGLPTPWLGLTERVNVYGYLLWVAVLAVALLRRAPQVAKRVSPTKVNGFVAPGFEGVRVEFERNFAERGEIGAAVAAYWHGEKVVDLWGGRRAPDSDDPWNEDTMVVVMSTTKGLAAMTLAIANSRGWLDYDAPVARYWPEFAQNGKATITVRQLLAHEAGLVLLDEPLTIDDFRDLDYVARVLARQRPAWTPGTRHGYHAMTIGMYMQEIIRRVDPAHRTLGQFFSEEIAWPLGLDFYIRLPAWVPDFRLATVKPLSPLRALFALGKAPLLLIKKVLQPRSYLRKSLAIPSDVDFRERRCLQVELPAGNGVGTARAIARAYSAFAEGGAELGITPDTFASITAPPNVSRPHDEVLGLPTYFSLGFARPGPDGGFGWSERGFGFPGAGGSFGFADPAAHVGYAYVMNKLDFWLIDDPREKALRDALYRAIARCEAPRSAPSRVTRSLEHAVS